MKIKIRNNVFETNSSSMHSIVLNTDKETTQLYTKEEALEEFQNNGVDISQDTLDLIGLCDPDEDPDYNYISFGWGVEIYNDFLHKFLYAIGSLGYNLSLFQELINAVGLFLHKKILVPQSKFSGLPHKSKVYIQTLVAIDHQSTDTLESFLEDSDFTVLDFILNPNIILIIDNDNH